jgi:large subunit ribosomal protein L10
MREEKQLLLDEVREKIDGSKGFIIARYEGLNAKKARAFRDTIAMAQGDFEVVRKRVFSKAAEAAGIKLGSIELQGHVGVIFAKNDALALSKIAVKYGEDNQKALQILGGMIDGTICSGPEVEQLAKLPSLDQLRSQFLSLLEGPLSGVVGVVQSALTSPLYCLDEKVKKEGQAE